MLQTGNMSQNLIIICLTFDAQHCSIAAPEKCSHIDRSYDGISSPLQAGTLVQRYKRFLADIITQDGRTITIHCANTGAMTGCATPGDTVWYSESANAKRKYPHSWELTQTQAGHLICVNTMQANRVVAEAIAQNRIPELAGIRRWHRK